MSSSSRTAQQKLADLEKTDAPLHDQLVEASKFIGLELSSLESFKNDDLGSPAPKAFYGKEEWVLRWLLKKLQGSEGTRSNAAAWRLLHHVVRNIPTPIAARALNDRKFVAILRETLEEANRKNSTRTAQEASSDLSSDSSSETESAKKSRKRRRSGKPVTPVTESSTPELREAILAITSYLVSPPTDFTKTSSTSSVASAELIKSVLRTTSDEAAKILGCWLSLCHKCLPTRGVSSFIQSFIDIWDSRKLGADATQDFSQHCTRPLLSLLCELSETASDTTVSRRNRAWKPQLDTLLARNVILPAKASADARTKLIDVHVIQDATLAPIILETCIRCVQPQEGRRRRTQDAVWLKEVFAALKSAISNHVSPELSAIERIIRTTHDYHVSPEISAIDRIIRIAIDYHLSFDIELLRSIAVEFAFDRSLVRWDLVTSLLELDSNVFLTSESESTPELLKQLLSHITSAAFQEDWNDIAHTVIQNVTIPLMNAFAKGRDLVGFMHHWHAQMEEFIRRSSKSSDTDSRYCAWEDDGLQNALRNVMEDSLTTPQIVHLVDWIGVQLQTDGDESVPAACVLLQAVAGSINFRSVETVDVLDSRLSELLFLAQVGKNLSRPQNQRYSWRRWTIPINVIPRAQDRAKAATAIWTTCSVELKKALKKGLESMNSYHATRCVCALWSAISLGHVPEQEIENELKKLVIKFLVKIDEYLADFAKMINDRSDAVDIEPPHNKSATYGWYANSYVACMLEEFPKIIELIPNLESSGQQILQRILRIASSQVIENSSLWTESSKCNMFPDIWNTALKNDDLLNNTIVATQFIDVMLQCTMKTETTGALPVCNVFVARSLHNLPRELLSKRHRELIIKSWPAKPMSIGYVDPIIWKLKMKVMEEYTFYDGMTFQILVEMAETLPAHHALDGHSTCIMSLVPIFGEFVGRTISHVLSTANQPKSLTFLKEVSSFLKSQSKHRKSFIRMPTTDLRVDGAKMPTQHAICDHIGIKLVDTALRAFTGKVLSDVLDQDRLRKINASFKKALISDLKTLLDLEEKGIYRHKDDHELFLSCALDALNRLELSEDDLKPVMSTALPFVKKIDDMNTNFAKRFESFLLAHAPHATKTLTWTGNVTTTAGRVAIKTIAQAQLARTDATGRLRIAIDMAKSIAEIFENTDEADVFRNEDLRLAKLKALEYAIVACEDSQGNEDGGVPGLSTVYDLLCKMLPRLKCVREFSLTCELMEVMVRNKSHAVLQHHIDSTLCAITTICSPNGPSIRRDYAGNVFTHLCDLFHNILSNYHHRRKIQDRFHIVLQSMEALLRCLFTPLPHTAKFFQANAGPPWLPSLTFPKKPLFPQTKHAEKFSSLITLICDPPNSAVSRNKGASAANLNSETETAKKRAGEHMIYLLTYYIKLRSGLRLSAENQDKLKPAIWSILATTTREMRELQAYELDAQGRVLWGELLADWTSFGKYKGN